MQECEINPCVKQEYEEPIAPTPVESDLVQVYDSIEQITNPNSNHIYVVGDDIYVFDGTRFLHTNECNIPPYTGEYTVTAPSDGNLVLPTKDNLMTDDLTIEANHYIEDALIQNTPMDEYVNDRVTTIGISGQNDAFSGTQIKKISFPNVTTCPASYAFNGRNVSTLEELYLPNLQSCGYGFAEANPNLRIIDFGKAFAGAKCRNCPNLEVLVVRDTSLKNVGSDWLSGCTKMLPGGSGGIVYVPQNLLSQYQASTAWQTYANVEFRPIEGSEYELEE